MILGQTYDEQLFNSEMFRLFINTFSDSKNGIINHYKQSCSLSNTSSTITIADGAFLLQGGMIQIQGNETVSVELDNTCCILVFEIDLAQKNTEIEFNQGRFKVVKGTVSTYPSLQQDDIVNNGIGIYQMEFARFIAGGSGISNFVDKRTFIDFGTIFQRIDEKLQEMLEELEEAIAHAGEIPVEKDVYTGTRVDDPIGTFNFTTTFKKAGKVVNIVFSVSASPTIANATSNFMTSYLGLPDNKIPEKYRPTENNSFNSTQNSNGSYYGYVFGNVFANGNFSGQLQMGGSGAKTLTTTITYIQD